MRRFLYLLVLQVLLLTACRETGVDRIPTLSPLPAVSSISFHDYHNVGGDVSLYQLVGIEGIDFGEVHESGIGFPELMFVTNGSYHKGGCSYFLGDPILLQCFGKAFDPDTSVQVQLLLRDVVIWEGEIIVPYPQ